MGGRVSTALLILIVVSCQDSADRVGAASAGGAAEAGQAGEAGAHDVGGAGAGGELEAGGALAGAAVQSVGGEGGAPSDAVAELCKSDTVLPRNHLVCTGLYADIATKTVAAGVDAYAPAIPLWSDGADKLRWISLPPGEKIDNSDPSEWIFPIGTQVWKEFSKAGRRVETRLWQKADTNYWVAATYAWNDDESAADRSAGGDIDLASGTYHIPTPSECQDCHRGRTDRLLGFEQVLLGLAGATGLNLDRLIADERLSDPPTKTPLVIGDDGTGLAAPALAWLHVNCGVSCHNDNSSSKAWATGLFMRLDPTKLDGSSVTDFDTLTTTIGVEAVTPAWRGQSRIAPGEPADSLLFKLISHRGSGQQMPPIATSVVDQADIPLVEAWIAEQTPIEGGAGGTIGGGGHSGSGGSGGTGHGGSSAGGTANGGSSNGGVPAGGTIGTGGFASGGSEVTGGSANGGGAATAGEGSLPQNDNH